MKAFALLLFISIQQPDSTQGKEVDPLFWRPFTTQLPMKPDLVLTGYSDVQTTFTITPKDSTNCPHHARVSCSVYGCGCGYCMDCGKRLKK